jgi:hypothetical protein
MLTNELSTKLNGDHSDYWHCYFRLCSSFKLFILKDKINVFIQPSIKNYGKAKKLVFDPFLSLIDNMD